jgi:hypothetical protein
LTKIDVYGKRLVIKWNVDGENEGSIDVIEEYVRRGGTVPEGTQVELSATFPLEPYKQTALTDNMPDNYLCAGSISTRFYQHNGAQGVIAISDYLDLTGHLPDLGDHQNLYIQWEVEGVTGHQGGFEGRHIELDKKLVFSVYLNDEKIFEDLVSAKLKHKKATKAP